VDVGFAKGFQLKHHLEYLIADNGRNTIKSLRYTSMENIDVEVLTQVIKEAEKLY
jgi:phosphoserine aminotransferase